MRPVLRLLATLVLVLASAAATTTSVSACSCGLLGYDEAIAAADVAFIGTVVGEDEPADMGLRPMPQASYAFDVSRSKTPIPSPFDMSVTFGNGANCGFDMAIGEEYLVIGEEWKGILTTNLCNGTALTGHIDAGELARIQDALSVEPSEAALPAEAGWPDVPAPVVAGGIGLALIGMVSLLAFRRSDHSA